MSSQVKDLHQLRAELYTFLSDAFLEELDEADLDRFAERASQDGTDLVPIEGPELDETAEPFEGTDLLREFGENLQAIDDGERATLVEDLAAEYASLFLTAGSKQVNPYESFYLGDEPITNQKPTIVVKNIYEELDYEAAGDHPEPEDHVGHELAFVAHLCRSAARSHDAGEREYARRYLNLQKEFLEKHLLEWAPDFCADVRENTDEPFYEAIALMTEDFLEQEPAMIEYMMELLEDEAS